MHRVLHHRFRRCIQQRRFGVHGDTASLWSRRQAVQVSWSNGGRGAAASGARLSRLRRREGQESAPFAGLVTENARNSGDVAREKDLALALN